MIKRSALIVSLLIGFSSLALADTPPTDTALKGALDKALELQTQGEYSKAIEEVNFALKRLNELNRKKVVSMLPEKLGEDYVAGEVSGGDALGLSIAERKYTSKVNGDTVTISLINAASGGAMANPFAMFGQMAAMAGAAGGAQVTRINGRNANIDGNKITVTLKGGSMLQAEGKNAKKLEEMLGGVNFDELEKYLLG